jgi:hypothetical protein
MSKKSLLLIGLSAILLLQSCFSEEDDHTPHWNTVRVWKDWRLDFEAGLPRTGTYFNGTTHDVTLTGNYDQPLSGGRDMKLTAVLNGTNGEGWAGVWVKHPSDQDMDASGAVGIRFRLKSSTARNIQVMLSSFAYPDYTNGAKLTGTIAAVKGDQTVELKFVDFVYPAWLYKSGQFCGSSQGAQTYCTTRMSDVLERVNAIQFQMDPRWDANGKVEDDWASIQVDDVQFVFP